MTECLKPVAKTTAGFYRPAADCAYSAKLAVRDGNTKESLATSVPQCLSSRFKVKAALVATAKQCLTTSLAKAVKPAVKMAQYTSAQLKEISGRIQACLSAIPETAAISSETSNDAFYQAENGYPKEALLDNSIVPFLIKKKVKTQAVASAKKCLSASLDKPLKA